MANADSSTNMLWLINEATAGNLTTGQTQVPLEPEKRRERENRSASRSGETSFDIKIDVTT